VVQEGQTNGKLVDFEDEFFDLVYDNYKPTSPIYKLALSLFQQKRKEKNEAEKNGLNEADYAGSDYAESDEEEENEESDDDDSDGEVDEMKALKDTNLYRQLGVATSATTVEIKKAFRKLAKKDLPDKGGDEEVFKRVNAAYEVLSNPQKREVYDTYCR
jgi:hypothetical protein